VNQFNMEAFEDMAITEAELESLLFQTLFTWSHSWSWGFTHSDSFLDFKLSQFST
jgi:hypothetical protein